MSYGQTRFRVPLSPTIVTSTVITALISGLALGGVLHATGQVSAVAAAYGLEGVVSDWVFVLGHSFVASIVFVAAVSRLASWTHAPLPLAEAPTSPFIGACIGIVYGTFLWLSIVVYGIPLWHEVVGGVHRPMPYHHVESFIALIWFGAVLGAWYPLVRRTLDRFSIRIE